MNAQSFLYHAKDATGLSFRAVSNEMGKHPLFVGNFACRGSDFIMNNLVSIANAYGYSLVIRNDATRETFTRDVNDVLLYICECAGISTNVLSHKIGNISDTVGVSIRRGSSLRYTTYISALEAMGYTAIFYNAKINDIVLLDNKPSIETDGLQN